VTGVQTCALPIWRLYGGFASRWGGPVFNIIGAITEGFERTDGAGSLIDNPDTTPIRMHSSLDWRAGDTVSMSSGGCPMYCSSDAERLSDILSDWGVAPGDTFDGHIEQTWDQ